MDAFIPFISRTIAFPVGIVGSVLFDLYLFILVILDHNPVENQACPCKWEREGIGFLEVYFGERPCSPNEFLLAFHAKGAMILSSNLGCKTHYEIIGVKEDASQEEIRRNYRSALLNFHPDKLHNSPETSNQETGSQFLDVQRAWNVLGDPRSRALYDNDLRKSRQDVESADEVSLEDMVIKDDGSCFELCYHCRCGDLFAIDSSELAEMGYPFSRNGLEICFQAPSSSLASIVLPCGSCSLKIRLIIDANVKLQVELNN